MSYPTYKSYKTYVSYTTYPSHPTYLSYQPFGLLTNPTPMPNPLKPFLDAFDHSNPDWSQLPADFPHCDLSGLSSADVGDFNAIRGLWNLLGPKQSKSEKVIAPHGGYRTLESYKNAEIIYDFTFEFTRKYIEAKSRSRDQMEQAARSGKQNIAEGSATSGTSKSSELRLIDVARSSLIELLEDYEDFIRTHKLVRWNMNEPRAQEIRQLAYKPDRTYMTYKTYMQNPEFAANAMLTLINQTCFLLDRQIEALEKDLMKNGDFNDRLKTQRRNRAWRGY
jgi:restriction system protein